MYPTDWGFIEFCLLWTFFLVPLSFENCWISRLLLQKFKHVVEYIFFWVHQVYEACQDHRWLENACCCKILTLHLVVALISICISALFNPKLTSDSNSASCILSWPCTLKCMLQIEVLLDCVFYGHFSWLLSHLKFAVQWTAFAILEPFWDVFVQGVKLLLDQLKPSHSARWARMYQASTVNTVSSKKSILDLMMHWLSWHILKTW